MLCIHAKGALVEVDRRLDVYSKQSQNKRVEMLVLKFAVT